MAKRKTKTDSSNVLITLIAIILVLGLLLIKLIINGIIVFVKWILRKYKEKEKKKQVNYPINSSFKNSPIKLIANEEESNLKEKLNLFDKNIYDDLFEIQIRRRGQIYYSKHKIRNFKHTNNKYTCLVEGTDTYKVSLIFNDENPDHIDTASCTCPYYTDKEKYCKHIYALLLKVKCEENPLKILDEITSYSNKMSEMIKNATEYLENPKGSLLTSDRNEFKIIVNNYKIKFERYSENAIKNKFNEDTLLIILKGLIKDTASLQTDIKRLFNNTHSPSKPKLNSKQSSDYNDSFEDIEERIFLADASDKQDDYDEKLERKMNVYSLTDWQKEEVRKGNYNPWNFEEDGELDEDDYYYEDKD